MDNTSTFTNFANFKLQREAALQEANRIIANGIEAITAILKEIGEVVEATGAEVDFYALNNLVSDTRREAVSGWASSSDEC